MAETAQQISRESPASESLDYARLLQKGIRHCQKLAADRWTDYNEHDPGVTILEQLCYALTDLAYRTHYRFEDILAERADPAGTTPADTFFPGDRILTCNPLTASDYRNLISDRLPEVGNLWVRPLESHPLGIRGLYEVLIETRTPGADPRLAEAVAGLMAAYRNLAEDVEPDRIVLLKPFPVEVTATIVADGEIVPGDLLADVLVRVQEGLVPDPEVRSVDAALDQGLTPEKILEGPRLQFGTVDPASLKPLPEEITLGQVRSAILSVPGVKRVKHLAIKGAANGRLKVDPDCVPHLSPSIFVPLPAGQDYPITIELEGGGETRVDRKRLWRELQARLGRRTDRAGYDFLKLENSRYLKVERGEPRNIASYYSIQHQFPAAYGIGKYGVPENSGLAAVNAEGGEVLDPAREQAEARTRRSAEARQLKAYLLFFEQLLADYLAQLANAPELFSLAPGQANTYFSLPVAHYPPLEGDPPNVIEVLNSLSGKGARHPAAGYAVCIVDRGAAGVSDKSSEILLKSQEVATDQEFRDRLAEILRAGGDSANYQWETALSGEIRLLLLGPMRQILAFGEERFVTAARAREGIDRLVDLLRALAGQPELQKRHVTRIFPRRAASARVIDESSRVLLNTYELPNEAAREQRVRAILVSGIRASNYEVVQHNNGEFGVVLRDRATKEIIAHGERRFTEREEAEIKVDDLAERLRMLRANAQPPRAFIQRLPDSSDDSKRRIVEDYQQALDEAVRDQHGDFLNRRNRFLDHLLSLFDEAFDNDALARLDPRGYSDKESFYEELIQWKIEFLSRYVALSGGRGRGFDFSTPQPVPVDDDAEENHSDLPVPGRRPEDAAAADFGRRSGFEQRLWLLLGLRGHIGPDQVYRRSDGPLAGIADSDGDGSQADSKPGLFEGEGLYVLEHILLRPVGEPAWQDAKAAAELYSQRISVLLPDWPVRFTNKGFRYFAESLIQANCPAHLACGVHWLDRPSMASFESIYREWLVVRLDPEGDPNDARDLTAGLRDFILWLDRKSRARGSEPLPKAVLDAVEVVRRKHPRADGSR